MLGFLRLLLGLFLLPACWGVSQTLGRVVVSLGGLSVPALAFLGGLAVFLVCWFVLPHPVRTYVLGHELTHALWGLCFWARPSRLRVGKGGGSVTLTKSNVLITLAPYFFPFYTFVVLVIAALVSIWCRPLPGIPVWFFFVGLTWAFHILFTCESLAQTQPDVTLYGRIFSWVFIYLANVLVIAVPLAWATAYGFLPFVSDVFSCTGAAYAFCWRGGVWLVHSLGIL